MISREFSFVFRFIKCWRRKVEIYEEKGEGFSSYSRIFRSFGFR